MGVAQISRIYMYQRSLEGKSAAQVTGDEAKNVADTAKGVAKNPEGAVERAVN